MANSPFKNKRDYMAKYKSGSAVQVRGLKDGFTRTFHDDGPFPVDARGEPVAGWRTKTPQSGRAEIIQKALARAPDPLHGPSGDDPEAVVPLWLHAGEGAPVKVFDPKRNIEIGFERMNPHYEKVMAFFIKQRNAIENQAREAVERKKREAEAKADEGISALVGAIAQRMAAAPAPAKKGEAK